MFLKQTIKKNPGMIETAFHLHRTGALPSDSFVVDIDTLMENAENMLKVAKDADIRLYFILKQLGRNPYIAKELVKVEREGAVVADYKEVDITMKVGILIGNISHPVQVPNAQLGRVAAYGPEVITVLSKEKIKAIDEEVGKLGRVQGLLIRMFDEKDMIYSGQTAGFSLESLGETTEYIRRECPHVKVKGVTSLPCYLYDEEQKKTGPTENLRTVLEGVALLEEMGMPCEIINTPSATRGYTIDLMKRYGGNCREPGRGLTGTAPMHAVEDMTKRLCVLYASEVSHNFKGMAYCYGRGRYRRSHMSKALVRSDWSHGRMVGVIPPSDESTDYHLGLSENCQVGDTTIMAFRYQIFVTRSDVALVKGLQGGRPEAIGIYDSLGKQK